MAQTIKPIVRGTHRNFRWSKKSLRQRMNRQERRDSNELLRLGFLPVDRKVYRREFKWQGDY